MLTIDPLTPRADALLRARSPVLVLSDFASAEFASAVARRVRAGEITPDGAHIVFADLDVWAARVTERVETTASDVKAAEACLRRRDTTLRTPDALNIAIAQRVGAVLATFGDKMRTSAEILGTHAVTA